MNGIQGPFLAPSSNHSDVTPHHTTPHTTALQAHHTAAMEQLERRHASEITALREEASSCRSALLRAQEASAGWEEALAAKEREAANLQVRSSGKNVVVRCPFGQLPVEDLHGLNRGIFLSL